MAAMSKRSLVSTISALLLSGDLPGVPGTSSKMDFLPLGNVRTDPVLNPHGLSGHVHTYYGAAASLRPETSYGELRAACGNSGNVDENKSLYWHPAIYKFMNERYHLVPIWFASAYYIWKTGETRAFPDGFQMIAMQSQNGANNPKARVQFECSGPSPCERDDCSVPSGHCAGRDAASKTCFPEDACWELEMKIVFPSCWDGENLTSPDFMSHVAYTEGDEGWFDDDCPASHPVRIPEIQLYFRVEQYEGGHHVFSDGSTMIHADYFSGWDQHELQRVLDECENDSEAAMPDAWCEDHLSFRDAPKEAGDEGIVSKLQLIQPPPLDLKRTVTDEEVDIVAELPSSATGGQLLPADPNLDWRCTPNCTLLGSGRGSRGTCDGPAPPPATTTPTTTTTTRPGLCKGKCSRNRKPWEKKCRWRNCRGCSQCSAQLLDSRPEEPQEAELSARRQEERASRGQAARKRRFLQADLDIDSSSLAQLSVQMKRGAPRGEEL